MGVTRVVCVSRGVERGKEWVKLGIRFSHPSSPQAALELGTGAGIETLVPRWEGSRLPRLTSPTSRGWRRAGGRLGGADAGAGA